MTKEDEIRAARDELKMLRRELGKIGLLSHGYVQDRGPGAGGPCYQWTRKVKAKTVSVALSFLQGYDPIDELLLITLSR